MSLYQNNRFLEENNDFIYKINKLKMLNKNKNKMKKK